MARKIQRARPREVSVRRRVLLILRAFILEYRQIEDVAKEFGVSRRSVERVLVDAKAAGFGMKQNWLMDKMVTVERSGLSSRTGT